MVPSLSGKPWLTFAGPMGRASAPGVSGKTLASGHDTTPSGRMAHSPIGYLQTYAKLITSGMRRDEAAPEQVRGSAPRPVASPSQYSANERTLHYRAIKLGAQAPKLASNGLFLQGKLTCHQTFTQSD
jgi:hypothetical protein